MSSSNADVSRHCPSDALMEESQSPQAQARAAAGKVSQSDSLILCSPNIKC